MRRPTILRSASDHDQSPLVAPSQYDLTASIADLAEYLLTEEAPSSSTADRALQQLRRRTRATDAVLWAITDRQARRVLYSGRRPDGVPSSVEFSGDATASDRLRLTRTVVCRFGEVSGVEELVPSGVESFVATAVIDRGTLSGVLVLGWSNAMPRWDDTNLRHLRIAAGLLARAAIEPSPTSDTVAADAILGSLADRIAVVDRDGTIVRVNAAWNEFGRHEGVGYLATVGPGSNYLAACHLAASNGVPEAAEILAGVEAVCEGASELYETTYTCHSPTEKRWCAMTVTPLRHGNGGAVIAHSDITPDMVMHLARRHGDEMFHRLADTLPVALWILAPDGRVLFMNRRGLEAAGGRDGDFAWIEAVHTDDRMRAVDAFRSALAHGEGFSIELRLAAADATFRWSACIGTPHYAPDGRVENVLMVCYDASAKHRAESTLNQVAAKLVAAQEQERSRIARELHDDLGQQVALLASKLEFAVRRKQSATRVQAGLADAQKTVQDLAISVHNLSHELHPAKLKLLGLGLTLETLCRNVSSESGVPVAFQRGDIPPDVPEDIALCVFRVTQEALHNAVKHSQARNISVQVAWISDYLTLRITDDGAGFDPLASQSAGLGLLTMRERVELMGAKLTIETSPQHGTTIEAALPMPTDGRAGADVPQRREESGAAVEVDDSGPNSAA